MNLDGPLAAPIALLYLFVAVALFFLMLPNFMVFPFSISPTSLMEFHRVGFLPSGTKNTLPSRAGWRRPGPVFTSPFSP